MTEIGYTKEQEAVAEMMDMMEQEYQTSPGIPSSDQAALSIELILEEAKELTTAIIQEDLVAIADGLGDLLVVLMGAANRYGIPMKPIFEEIHRSNMTKVWPDNTPDSVKYTKSGKYLKPDTYSPPRLQAILDAFTPSEEEEY